MKLSKENIYVPLEGYSEEELTELYNFLESINEPCEGFLNLLIKRNKTLEFWDGTWFTDQSAENKTPVTIEQLKEILQPMETFTPVAMRCTQEQFENIKPKLKGFDFRSISKFNVCNYLINNLNGNINMISNISESHKMKHNRAVHEEWDEEIFLKACGIEAETLQEKEQRLLKELEVVRKEIEYSKIKEGDWVVVKETKEIFKVDEVDIEYLDSHHEKITNPQLIELLENEVN